MNGSKLMDALQYIDDDLLEQAQQMRDGSTAEKSVSADRKKRKVLVRRLPYIAALAAASLLAVFTLRFVSGINMGSHDSSSAVPKAEEAAAPAAEEYAVEEAAPAAPEAESAQEEVPGTAGSSPAVMYDMAEETPAEVPAETGILSAQTVAMKAADEDAGEEAVTEAAVTEAAAAEEIMAEEPEEAVEMEAARIPAAAAASASAENMAREETTADSAYGNQAGGIRAFIDDALSGRAASLENPSVRFDGSVYTVSVGGREYSYRNLLTGTYTDEQGTEHTVYILSNEDEMTESEMQTAAEQGISAEKGYILPAE